ncbi:cadherin-related family member 2 [Genypterus blacodes]|uniref:cadherin-related family member 2 n=1 Tax=Genypterus blacodes TaxID=154954 RepID=UPI003F7768F8
MGKPTGSILLLCLISVTNANLAPVISNVVERVCEEIDLGAQAFTISATDPENDKLNYAITPPSNFFEANADTGVVTVKRLLDRDASDSSLRLTLFVSDGRNDVTQTITVLLGDANDNAPIFDPSTYDVNVLENTTIGTPLFSVLASDLDSTSILTYSIQEVIPKEGKDLFTIVPGTGEVGLAGSLNYNALSTFYRLRILVTDGGGGCGKEEVAKSGAALAYITVVDVPNLAPVFLRVPYTARVEENSPVGKSVLTVTAIDQDTGINDDITYSIEPSTADDLFSISSTSGVISVLANIDRELVGDSVILTVKATEVKQDVNGLYANTTTTVDITIDDFNDNRPEFWRCAGAGEEPSCELQSIFTGEIVEHSLGSVIIAMTVKDADTNSKIALSLDGADKAVFSVEPKSVTSQSAVQLNVVEPQNLDFEKKQQMILQVIAIDEENDSLRSTATVTVRIQDANDNRPEFPQDTYKINVAEHTPDGTIIKTIVAADPDTMDQGKLNYTLLPESILKYFGVDLSNGSVYVKDGTLLDREGRSLYSATLQARDTDGKPGSTVLEITLTDINDQAPIFNRESYQDFLPEGGQVNIKIEATDGDDPDTANSQIVYTIDPSKYSNNFTIDPNTGVLRNKIKLDRETIDPTLDGKIELNVTATDKGIPALSSTVTVTINVQDVNDNAPQFNASSYKFSVNEGEKGVYVGSVEAHDLDQTSDFNRITFSITEGSFGSFAIRTSPETHGFIGKISVDQGIELDYESERKSFKLRVEAEDLDQKTAFVMVDVEVLDVNDERPEFQPTTPVAVKENTTSTDPIGKFTAHDKDANNSLIYALESLKCRCNGTEWKPCDWFTLEPTGDIIVNPEETVDYELCDQAVMTAQVVDQFTEKGENNSVTPGEIVINIEDINDNVPEFILSNSVFVVVSESASAGTSVAAVTAEDRDSGKNSEIKFKVPLVQFQDTNSQIMGMPTLFEAVTTQQNNIYIGIIQSMDKLDAKLNGKYLVTVTATDGVHSTSTVLDIFTVDESFRIELRFASSKSQVLEDKDGIVLALTIATKAAVRVVSIEAATPEASVETVMELYFIYPNGTALSSETVGKKISEPEYLLTLSNLGLISIGTVPGEPEKPQTLRYILLGMVAGLVIVLTVLTTSLICTRRNYRRKLKAAKAMNTAELVASVNQKSGPMVPGTNKYTMEGANPVLNLHIDTAMDEQSSDVDKISLNSLDYSDDMGKDTSPIMNKIQEEDEDQGPPEYIEPLGAALAQRGRKTDPGSSPLAYSNPALSLTSDL